MNSGEGYYVQPLRQGGQDWDMSEGPGLSLSRQTELVTDALVAGAIVRLANRLMKNPEALERSCLALLQQGIDLARRLQTGEHYLRESVARVIWPPDSAETVQHIHARGTQNVSERTQEAVDVLSRAKRRAEQGSDSPEATALDPEEVRSIRDFYRVVRTSIMDQLGPFDIPSERADWD